ncbi:MAG: Spy/CpxP family protein refolding chaperone [Neisseria sp.]|nr:Spy/CpxP family protein refolding chaperone [Neisseria sp.]
MKKVALIGSIIAALALTACASGEHRERGAREGKHGTHKEMRHHGGEHMKAGRDGLPREFARLNLSEEQKTKIKAIVEANQAAMQNMEKPQAKTREAVDYNQAFNEQAARQEIAQRQQQHAEMQIRHMKMKHEIMQVLTAEQREQLQSKGDKKRGM